MLLSKEKRQEIASAIASGALVSAKDYDIKDYDMFLQDTETMKILEIEKANGLDEEEIENLENAINEYDYLCNDGTIFKDEEDLMSCFVKNIDEDFETYEPTKKVKIAFMQYVYMHEKLYIQVFDNHSCKIASEFLAKQK